MFYMHDIYHLQSVVTGYASQEITNIAGSIATGYGNPLFKLSQLLPDKVIYTIIPRQYHPSLNIAID